MYKEWAILIADILRQCSLGMISNEQAMRFIREANEKLISEN